MFYKVAKVIISALLHALYRIEIRGAEKIPPEDGALICPNHKHNLDPFLVAICMKRQVRFMAKYEAFKNPVLRFLLLRLGMFPVKRGEADINAVKTTLKILKDKQLVGLFPEGTRIKEEKLGKANAGVAVFAIKSGKPVIPVFISGNFKPFTKMTVTFGEPVYLNQFTKGRVATDEYADLSQIIMEKINNIKEGLS